MPTSDQRLLWVVPGGVTKAGLFQAFPPARLCNLFEAYSTTLCSVYNEKDGKAHQNSKMV